MQTILYDGSFEGWLCAVFDIYEYKFSEADICRQHLYKGNVFGKIHQVAINKNHSERVWKGLEKKLTPEALQQVYQTFLSELPDIENRLLQYVQYVFSTQLSVEKDYSHPAILIVTQTAKKVWKEKHRMEAFIRFQQTKDDLFYAIVEPDYNVLPLISHHFQQRYADQRWLIYDIRRKYGIYYDLCTTSLVTLSFDSATNAGKDITPVCDENEILYQQLWQHYFKSVTIPARKNTKLHIQHMPVRYWKYLPEKRKFVL